MKIFLYILREYAKYVIGVVILAVFLFLLFDFIHKSGNYFPKHDAQTQHIFRFYIYQLPNQIKQALPIAALLASVVCMILLSRTNEITAMRAAGMGPYRIGLPLAAGGLALSVTAMVLGEWAIPQFAQRAHYVKDVLIEGKSDSDLGDGVRWLRDGDRLVNFGDYDPITRTMRRVKMVGVLSNFRPSAIIEAQTATYLPDTESWRFEGIKVTEFDRAGEVSEVFFEDERVEKLPIEPKKLRKSRRTAEEMTLRELEDSIRVGEQSGANVLAFRLNWHSKFAYPFAAFVLSLVGLKFGYKSERATETAKGVLIAFAIGLSYWFVMSSTRALGLQGHHHVGEAEPGQVGAGVTGHRYQGRSLAGPPPGSVQARDP